MTTQMTVTDVVNWLRQRGKANTARIYRRRGAADETLAKGWGWTTLIGHPRPFARRMRLDPRPIFFAYPRSDIQTLHPGKALNQSHRNWECP